MEDYKNSLAKKGKTICPKCGRKTFVLYLNNSTGEPIHSTAGKCDRADNCGHHCTPAQYYRDNNILFDDKRGFTPISKTQPKPQPSYIDEAVFKRSLRGYDNNTLVAWLFGIVGVKAASKAIKQYHIGTSKNGGCVFWQIDMSGKVRDGKIIRYDLGGHRRKDAYPPVQWTHSVLKIENFNLKQCFFGEHLLRDTTKMIAIVEGEKTALLSSIYLPDYVWLATGGADLLNPENDSDKFRCLSGRDVTLFPDASKDGSAFAKWSKKVELLRKFCQSVSVSSLIETHATDEERSKGYDLADYLIRFPLSDFVEQAQPEETPTLTASQSMEETPKTVTVQQVEALLEEKPTAVKEQSPITSDTIPYYAIARRRGDWSGEIEGLEKWFSTAVLPESFRLSSYELITDCRLFVGSRLLTVKQYNGNPIFRPYLDELLKFKNKLSA